MHDPFPFPPPPLLARLTTPIANALALPTLPLHIHELLCATLVYHVICRYISPYLSSKLFPRTYPALNARTKLNWDVHVVSLAQSLIINTLALWVMWTDEERGRMEWDQRVWGYTGASGMIQGFAAGYFLWDLITCVGNVAVFGWGLLAHAVAALVVFSLGFRPFVNFYGPTFILYELSSPFLNFHWFFDKLHMTGSRPQWYNGMFLLSSFFCCRLLWGTYQSIRVYQDVWAALHYDPLTRSSRAVFEPEVGSAEIMRFAGDCPMPAWLAIVYMSSNIVLNTLNFYWFSKMIETIRKRFSESKDKKGGRKKEDKDEGVMVEGLMDSSTLITEVAEDEDMEFGGEDIMYDEEVVDKLRTESKFLDGKNGIEVKKTEIRQRKV
ncbi:TLC domain-containing protein [Usnea florida]